MPAPAYASALLLKINVLKFLLRFALFWIYQHMRYTCGMHVPNVFSMHPMSVSEHGQSFSAWV